MVNPYVFIVIYRIVRDLRRGDGASAKGATKRSRGRVLRHFLIGCAIWFATFVSVAAFMLGCSFALVRATPEDLFFSAFRYQLIGAALVLSLLASAWVTDYVNAEWGSGDREEKTKTFQLLAERLERRDARLTSVLCAGILAALSFLTAISHISVTRDSVVLQRLASKTVYPFSEVTELNFYRKFADSKGVVTNMPTCDIHFRDGYVWFSNGWNIAISYGEATKIIKYISKQTGIRYTVQDLHRVGS